MKILFLTNALHRYAATVQREAKRVVKNQTSTSKKLNRLSNRVDGRRLEIRGISGAAPANAASGSRHLLLYSCPNAITRRAAAFTNTGAKCVMWSLIVLPTTWITGAISFQTYLECLIAFPLTIAAITLISVFIGLGFRRTLAYLRLAPSVLYRPITDLYLRRDTQDFLAVSAPLLGPKRSFVFRPKDVTGLGLVVLSGSSRRKVERILGVRKGTLLFNFDHVETLHDEDTATKSAVTKLYSHIDAISFNRSIHVR